MDTLVQNLIANKISPGKSRFVSIGGGSINQTFRLEIDNRKYFCKINSAKKFPDLFQKEKNGLAFLDGTQTVFVPKLIWCGEAGDRQVLVMEWIEQGMRSNTFWKKFGERLAKLHSSHQNGQTQFGFREDNYMGALSQLNSFKENWVEFFVTCRLEPQLKLATDKGLIGSKEIELFRSLYKKLDSIFPHESASPLHGDLWSGNYLCGRDETPVLIDPAVYYGHRSIDLGMTRLFGGFDQLFYEAYHYHYPLPKNFDEQADVCNLYPLLIHLNLFGSGYLGSIHSVLGQFA